MRHLEGTEAHLQRGRPRGEHVSHCAVGVRKDHQRGVPSLTREHGGGLGPPLLHFRHLPGSARSVQDQAEKGPNYGLHADQQAAGLRDHGAEAAKALR